MSLVNIGTATGGGGEGYTSKAFVDNPIDKRNLATIQRSGAIRAAAMERQGAVHSAFIKFEEEKYRRISEENDLFGKIGKYFSWDGLSELAGGFVGNYLGEDAGKFTKDVLGSQGGNPDIGSYSGDFNFGKAGAEFDAANKRNEVSLDLTNFRGVNVSAGPIGRMSISGGEAFGSTTDITRFSKDFSKVSIGDKFPDFSFKMPIGQGVEI